MKSNEFDKIVERRIELIKEVLVKKAKEYSSDQDRLHNFHVAANVWGITPEMALFGMMLKHVVSVIDIVDKTKKGVYPDIETIDEKIGDTINYLILLEATLRESIKSEEGVIRMGNDD